MIKKPGAAGFFYVGKEDPGFFAHITGPLHILY